MAISKTNLLTHGFSGKLGEDFVLKNYSGKSVLSKRPDFSNITWSGKQVNSRQVAKMASKRAAKMAKDPKIRKEYIRKYGSGKTVFCLIFGELVKEMWEKAKSASQQV